MRFFSTLLIVVLSLSRTAAIAADQIPVVGVWKLVSYERKILETGKIEKTLGEKPTGYLTYTAGKHFSVFVFGADRKRPVGDVPTPEEALMLYRSTSASYAGTYSVEGNKVVHHVDVAWTPAKTTATAASGREKTGSRQSEVLGTAHWSPWRLFAGALCNSQPSQYGAPACGAGYGG